MNFIAEVAQSVERRPEKPCVTSSILVLGILLRLNVSSWLIARTSRLSFVELSSVVEPTLRICFLFTLLRVKRIPPSIMLA